MGRYRWIHGEKCDLISLLLFKNKGIGRKYNYVAESIDLIRNPEN
jgi:hypothetical protein